MRIERALYKRRTQLSITKVSLKRTSTFVDGPCHARDCTSTCCSRGTAVVVMLRESWTAIMPHSEIGMGQNEAKRLQEEEGAKKGRREG